MIHLQPPPPPPTHITPISQISNHKAVDINIPVEAVINDCYVPPPVSKTIKRFYNNNLSTIKDIAIVISFVLLPLVVYQLVITFVTF